MAALRVFLSLSVLLLLEHQTLAFNIAPCLPSKWNNAYNTFVRRHICFEKPNTEEEWKAYIKSIGCCDRPTQSFLSHLDLEAVKAVCTKDGGKVFKANQCISKKQFTFTTIRIDTNTGDILSITTETKHLILACDLLPDGCLPVHFEGNPKSLKPDNNARACQASETKKNEKAQRLLVHCNGNLEYVRLDNNARERQDPKIGKDGKAQCLPGHSDRNQESLWSDNKARDSQDLNTREDVEAQRLLVHCDGNLEYVRLDNKATDSQDLKDLNTREDDEAQRLPGHSDRNQESLWSDKKTRDSQDLNTKEDEEALRPTWLWALPSLLFGIFAKIVKVIIIIIGVLLLLSVIIIFGFCVPHPPRLSTTARPVVQASL